MRVEEWFAERIPEAWGVRAIEVLADADEILVIADLGGRRSGVAAAGSPGPAAGGSPGAPVADAVEPAAVARFREVTREERMAIAAAAEARFSRKVSWGVRHGRQVVLFTTSTVPVMTRLRLSERRVLDTLIDGGLARTRSEALAWCVRLVAEHEGEWLEELRAAYRAVEDVRSKGPRSRRP